MGRKRSPQEIDQINADLRSRFGNTMTRADLLSYEAEVGVFPVWIYRDPSCKVGRGLYKIPGAGHVVVAPSRRTSVAREVVAASKVAPVPAAVDSLAQFQDSVKSAESTAELTKEALSKMTVFERMQVIRDQASLLSSVPAPDAAHVPFGDYDTILQVIRSGRFFPFFVTGLSGNGKTYSIRQACAVAGREYIRVNITAETDEDDLIGGFRLIDGNTVFEIGPVLVAMIRGAVLLIDEIDYASPKIACLQPILEGNAITVKKLGITIAPAPGFTIFATANTKGRGDETGKFVGANLLNEAFLERFPVTIEQDYPSAVVEKKILMKQFVAKGFELTDHARVFFDTLSKWAEGIRQTYTEGGVEDLISTRRLVMIAEAYGIFGDDAQALMYCVNRFEPKTREAFGDLYNRLAPDVAAPSNVGNLDGEEVNEPQF